jgi:hypothetical protein
MIALAQRAELNIDPDVFRQSFDRVPFGFTHSLSELDLFGPDSLRRLAEIYGRHPRDFYIASGAPWPGAEFYSVPHPGGSPLDSLERLESGRFRVLLKRPEKFDPRFRELLDTLFRQIVDLKGGLGREKVVRLESAILISSAATITPFHFDPEINFFSQIEGEKIYHVYPPAVLTETELERFYIRGAVNIGQVSLQKRNPADEHVYTLGPGKGFHQPQNAPHWVQTSGGRSVSYAFVFETNATRACSRVRAFNYYLRKLRLKPASPGRRRLLDGFKSGTMRAVIPMRKVVVKVLEKILETI